MAPPPSYSDLGKQARDVFDKGYPLGFWKLDCKTKTESGVEFSTSGNSNLDSGKVTGSLETKYKINDYGVTLSEKWTTDNTLSTEVTHTDKFLNGLKLTFVGSFAPHTGIKNGKVKASYGQDLVKIDTDVDINLAGPLINASGVVGYEGWLAGYQTAFDTKSAKLTTNNFAVGYVCKEFAVHTSVGNGKDFNGSVYHKVNNDLGCGVQLSWQAGSNNTKFGIGAQYNLDKDATVRAKVDNSSTVGLGYQQKLRDGIALTLTASIDGKNFNAGGHRIGVALDLEA